MLRDVSLELFLKKTRHENSRMQYHVICDATTPSAAFPLLLLFASVWLGLRFRFRRHNRRANFPEKNDETTVFLRLLIFFLQQGAKTHSHFYPPKVAAHRRDSLLENLIKNMDIVFLLVYEIRSKSI